MTHIIFVIPAETVYTKGYDQQYHTKLDNAKRGIPSQGAKLTLTYDPVTKINRVSRLIIYMRSLKVIGHTL